MKVIVKLEEHEEGLVLYTSDQPGQQDLRTMAFLALGHVQLTPGQPVFTWRLGGAEGTVAEMLAKFYADRPGMKEAVDGLYAKEIMDRARGLRR